MNPDEYRQFLLDRIPTAVSVSGGSHVACRCFYCPDGKSSNTKHFYISIPKTPEEPSMYYCHKCHASGIVTNKTLIDWGIYDKDIATDLINHNKNVKIVYNNTEHKVYKLVNNYTTQNKTSEIKLKYINDRLGTNLTYEDLQKLKIVLNLKDILNQNNIHYYSRSNNVLDQLNEYFIGFLSVDNSYLNMRRVCKEGYLYEKIDKRYINYKIFQDDNTERFYTVPTAISLDSPNRVRIHIAEGPFDILSIFLNVRKQEPGVYTSIGGSNYLKVALYIIQNYKLPFVELHFYPDNDEIGNKAMQYIGQYFIPLGIPIYIHRNIYKDSNGNECEKDFGVPMNHIVEGVERIN